MENRGDFVSGFVAGAAAMYLLDPERGRRRRAVVRDKAVHAAHVAEDGLSTAARDLGNRATGIVAEGRARLLEDDVPDEVLVERVRAELGRLVSHPSSIIATSSGGRVTLSGPVLADELENLLAGIRAVRGVQAVENRLEVHQFAGDVPGLQGGTPRTGERFELLQENWTPAARLLVGVAGGALALVAARRRDAVGSAMSAAGFALLTRSITNKPASELAGAAGRRSVHVQKAININAPVERVFAFWNSYENFPYAMSHVREVRETGRDRSHWVVDGPAGVPVEWDAVVTERTPNRRIAWESVPGSIVESAGVVTFEPLADGGTHIDVKLTYTPPAGAAGHAVATLFGANPKQQMDDDLARVKTMIETGTPPRDAARRSAPQAEAQLH